MIEVVVSDFGGVLTTPLEASFRIFSEHTGVPLEVLGRAMWARTERDGGNPLHALETGRMTEADFLAGLGSELERLGHRLEVTGFSEVFFSHLDVNGGMLDALAGWKARGLRLALCTNNVAEWEPWWRAMLPVDELFEVVVDSAFVGVRKPDREIYEIVLDRLGGVPAQACVFIDDLAENCDAARAVGMDAVHFVETAAAVDAVERALAAGRD